LVGWLIDGTYYLEEIEENLKIVNIYELERWVVRKTFGKVQVKYDSKEKSFFNNYCVELINFKQRLLKIITLVHKPAVVDFIPYVCNK
jgi:hypothetical protein